MSSHRTVQPGVPPSETLSTQLSHRGSQIATYGFLSWTAIPTIFRFNLKTCQNVVHLGVLDSLSSSSFRSAHHLFRFLVPTCAVVKCRPIFPSGRNTSGRGVYNLVLDNAGAQGWTLLRKSNLTGISPRLNLKPIMCFMHVAISWCCFVVQAWATGARKINLRLTLPCVLHPWFVGVRLSGYNKEAFE